MTVELELAAALERADDLRRLECDPYHEPYDRLVLLLDAPVEDATIVERHGDEIAELLELDRADVARWVALARGPLLERHARELNHAADSMGATGGYVVAYGIVVVQDGDVRQRELERRILVQRTPTRPSVDVAVRARSRGRRRRPTSSRRRRARAPAGEPDEPEPPARRRTSARAAA